MAEYIEREAAVEAICDSKDEDINSFNPITKYNAIYYAIEAVPAADVVSRATFEQVMWERDVAIQQLKDLGVGFGEKADVAPVVRCKDCKYRSGLVGKAPFMVYICNHDKGLSGAIRETDFCSYGEPKRERRSE